MNKLYVLQYWFWEGDDHLVNSFCGIFDNVESVPKHIKEYAPKYKSFHTKEEIPCKYKGFYTDSDIGQSPNENDGSYRMPGFYTFTYLNLNELIRQK